MAEPVWQEIGGHTEGTVFNTKQLDRLVGTEIGVDILQPDTTLGQIFFFKMEKCK